MSKSCFVLTVTRPVQASQNTMFAAGSDSKSRTVFIFVVNFNLLIFFYYYYLFLLFCFSFGVGWHACCNTRVGDGGGGYSGTAWSLTARCL